MKKLDRKIKGALIITAVCLLAFIGFSKTGILFTTKNSSIVTVTTTKKTFDPNYYVASMAALKENVEKKEEKTTTTSKEETTKTTTTAKVTKTTTVVTTTEPYTWTGDVLSKSKGVVQGPSGKETYYNLNMNVIVNSMRNLGYSEQEYPYWIREDGVKMFGNYVMVAASYNIRPRGTILESSLGKAIVCDTGGFAKNNPTQIDVAVAW